MTFNRFLLKGTWFKVSGKVVMISSVLLSLFYFFYLALNGDKGKVSIELIYYIQTHFIVFNMVVLPLYLLMFSVMIQYYQHDQIRIKYSKASVMVKNQIALILVHTLFFIIIANLPSIVLATFNDGFEMLFFISRSMFVQVPGYILAASILLYIYSRSQQQGLSLLLSILLLIAPQIIGTIVEIEGMRSLDYYIYLKDMDSFAKTESIVDSLIFVFVSAFISLILFLLTSKTGPSQE